ncbi:mitochondrial carrier protein LEU5 [Xylariaceae sp. FL0016]|nr:mitochondrial carrier protein LEU5 [Xylariaceae sp. FL0016]
MPSALSNHASQSEIPTHQGDTDGAIGGMDGVVKKVSSAVAGISNRGTTQKSEPDAQDRAVTAAGTGKWPSMLSLDRNLRTGIAGGIAGCAAKTFVAPLDRVKILFQTSNPQFAKYTGSWVGLGKAMKAIYANDGVLGLYRGNSATLLRIFPYSAIKFLTFERYLALFVHDKQQETWLPRFMAGAMAGVTSVFLTYPLEVLRVRLAFETRHRSSSLVDICKKIYYEHPLPKPSTATPDPGAGVIEGAAKAASATVQAVAPRSGLINFYRGFAPTLIGMVPYGGMGFLTHGTIGDIFRLPLLSPYTTLPQPSTAPKNKPRPLTWWAQTTAGGIAGLVSQTVSYPFEVVRRRMQVGGAVGDGHRLRIGETVAKIFKESGARGFFVGLSIGYVKMVPMTAMSFYAYERMKTLFAI